MALISQANLLLVTDKIGYLWDRIGLAVGTLAYPNNPRGSGQWLFAQALYDILQTGCGGGGDFQQIDDMAKDAYTGAVALSQATIAANAFSGFLTSLQTHIADQGKLVDASIVDLASYLNWYDAIAPFSLLLHSSFGDCFLSVTGAAIQPDGLEQPSLNPLMNPAATNGLGSLAVSAGFVAGVTPNTTYSAVTGAVQVTTTFVGGSAPPTVTVAGTDHLGNLTTTWTATLAGNNPVSAVSTTITPAVLATSRVNVAVASATGIVVGSVLTVNAGLFDQEVISVEAVIGSTITAVFDKAHLAGAALAGMTTAVLVPSLAGARIASVSGIALGLTGHSAGQVQVFGVLDRQHDPS